MRGGSVSYVISRTRDEEARTRLRPVVGETGALLVFAESMMAVLMFVVLLILVVFRLYECVAELLCLNSQGKSGSKRVYKQLSSS